MVTHLEFRLYGGYATATRLVARLHALGVEVDELHASAERMCVHLTNERDLRRVRTALNRSADAEVGTIESGRNAPCRLLALPIADRSRTTYIVWSEPLNPPRRRHHRGGRIRA